MSNIIYLALGSNLGDKLAYIKSAYRLLTQNNIIITQYAPLYESDAVGVTDQPTFLNTVVATISDLSPIELLNVIKKIEKQIGRKKRQIWGPREIDIDIILYKDTICRSTYLTIPHAEMLKREFVLLPLSQIAPNVRHPENNQTIKQLLDYYYANTQDNTRSARIFTPTKTEQ